MTTKTQKTQMEQPVTTHTFFKVSLVEPLQTIKESFMEAYKDQPAMLKTAGLIGARPS